MAAERIRDQNVLEEIRLPAPFEVKEELLLSQEAQQFVLSSRGEIERILDHRDPRHFIITGPCSVHDVKAGTEYAERLKSLSDEVSDVFLLIMRVYFSKPRTTVGWKGLINDPYMDDSFRIQEGLYIAREFLVELTSMGIPTGTEALDPIIPQYLDDLISWHAIGARTTESQMHRELASGLSTPVGFKNSTDGNIQVAINALKSVSQPHHFLGINQKGECTIIRTRGNSYGHIVLRGGGEPNYDSVSIRLREDELKKAGLPASIVVDCSHGNSMKTPELQPRVFEDCINQIIEGNQSISGLMLESNLKAGHQQIPDDLSELRYGVSITDACIDWDTTETIIRKACERLRKQG